MTEWRELAAAGGPVARVRECGDVPVIAFALHAGHAVRTDLVAHMGLTEEERLREEDPFTGLMAPEGISLVEAVRSRFEVDLNRPRYRAVYQGAKDAWGLDVWAGELPDEADRASRSVYDAFYAGAFEVLSRFATRHERFVILDLHAYNHRRGGPDASAADSAENPDVNLGTRRLDATRWAPVTEAFLGHFAEAGVDARENVKFGGGHFAHWVCDTFGDAACPLAIEFKKTYMDEWTGEPDHAAIEHNRALLTACVPPLCDALDRIR